MRRTTITVVTLAIIATVGIGVLVGSMAGGSRAPATRVRIPAQPALGSPAPATPLTSPPASSAAAPSASPPAASPHASLVTSTHASSPASTATPAAQGADPPAATATPARTVTPTVLARLTTRAPATTPVRAASTEGALEPAPAASPSPAATITPTRTATSVPTATATSTPRETPSPSATPTVTPSTTPTATPHSTSPAPTATPTASPLPTATATPALAQAAAASPTGASATGTPVLGPAPVVETQGWVVIEAEAAEVAIARSGHAWEQRADHPGYAGSGYLMAVPDDGLVVDQEVAATSPELRYLVVFPQRGTYYVWLRGWASDGGSDSAWIGLDGEAGVQPRRVEGFAAGAWSWSGQAATQPVALEVAEPGLHAVHIWMREDGLALDQIVISHEPALPATPGGQPGGAPLAAGTGGLATPSPVVAGDGTGGPAPGPERSSAS